MVAAAFDILLIYLNSNVFHFMFALADFLHNGSFVLLLPSNCPIIRMKYIREIRGLNTVIYMLDLIS